MSQLSGITTNLVGRQRAGCVNARHDLIAHSCERLRCLTRTLMRADYARLQRWEHTDDVVQNALMRLTRALYCISFDSSAHFWNLATRLIRRELIDLARHHFGPEGHAAHHDTGTGKAFGVSAAVDRKTPSVGMPSTKAEWAEFLGLTEKLPEDERRVFDLHWVLELPQAEVAVALNVSLSTVKRLWRNCLEMLGILLRDNKSQ